MHDMTIVAVYTTLESIKISTASKYRHRTDTLYLYFPFPVNPLHYLTPGVLGII